MSHATNHHGIEIDAERDEGGLWRPVVDGDYYGSRTYLSSRDALRAAERAVERRLGIARERSEPFTIDPEAPEPEWVADLRDSLRDTAAPPEEEAA